MVRVVSEAIQKLQGLLVRLQTNDQQTADGEASRVAAGPASDLQNPKVAPSSAKANFDGVLSIDMPRGNPAARRRDHSRAGQLLEHGGENSPRLPGSPV
jgi:hypothetical protein